jgi:hypothetical protein
MEVNMFRALLLVLFLIILTGCTTTTERVVSRKTLLHQAVLNSSRSQEAPVSSGLRVLKVEHRSSTADLWRRMIRQKSVLLENQESLIVFRGQVKAPDDGFVFINKGTAIYALVYVEHQQTIDVQFSVVIPETGETLVQPTQRIICGEDSADYLMNLPITQRLIIPAGQTRSLVFVVTPTVIAEPTRLGVLPLRIEARVGRIAVEPQEEPRETRSF